MPKIVSKEVENVIIQMAKEGKTRNAISEATGLALATIRRILQKEGVMPQRKTPATITDDMAEKVVLLYQAGRSMGVISSVTGLSHREVGKIIRTAKETRGDFDNDDREPVSPYEFIEAWQASESIDEVSLRLKIKPSTVKARASMYRDRGVPLKHYSRGGKYNWTKLAEYAEWMLEDKDALHEDLPEPDEREE